MDDAERARRRVAERNTSSWYKLKEGENTFRLLPTPASRTSPPKFFDYRVHRDVGPNKQQMRCGYNYNVETGDWEGKCHLCDKYIPQLRAKKAEGRAGALEAKDVALFQVASVDDKGKMHGPLLFTPSKKVADQLLSQILGSKKRKYDDPVNGRNLTLSRTGMGKFDTVYGIITADEDPSPVPQKILSVLKPFSQLTEIPTYSENKQRAAILGSVAIDRDEDEEDEEEELVAANEDEDDEEEEVVASKKKPVAIDAGLKTSKKTAKAPPVEEEDLDEEVEDEEESAPPPPKKQAAAVKKVAKPPIEEDLDEDLDEDEDADGPYITDEEPAPPSKKAVAKKSAKPAPPVEEDEEEGLDIEDDDLDEIDEEEEPPPPKKAAAAKKSK